MVVPQAFTSLALQALLLFFFFFGEITEMKYTMVLAECQGYSTNERAFAFPKGMFVYSQ